MPQQVTYVTMVGPKSTGLAYVLLVFLGGFGVHKFYTDKVGMGVAYICLSFIGGLLTTVYIGWLLIVAAWIMLVIDLFTPAGDVRRINETRQRDVANNMRPSHY